MEEPDHRHLDAAPPSSTSSLPAASGPDQGASPPPSPPPPPSAEDEERGHRLQARVTYRVSISSSTPMSAETTRDDACSCFIVLITFCFFVSMTLILGIYSPVDLVLGPNSSRLLRADSLFVQNIMVKSGADDSRPGPMLYGFSKHPPLHINTSWSETHNVSIPASYHKEWVYYLNKGSQIDVLYNVKPQGPSYPLTLIVAQGKESLIQWIMDPSYPNTTVSWNVIHGSGFIQQKIDRPSDYYVAVANLNQVAVEVQLDFRIQAFLYNTTEAYYKCALDHSLCVLKLFFLRANAAILTTSGPKQNGESDYWYFKLSYGPRWITYFIGSGVMIAVILLVFKIITLLQSNSGDSTNFLPANMAPERAPLLTNKDDDNSSLGSSYDSVSHDEDGIEESLGGVFIEPKSLSEIDSHNPHCHCTICFDASKDCFFLPCGHCATCFSCGTRVIEEAGTCPICRRKMKKVRRIFTV